MTVADTTDPAITCPSDPATTEATSPSGAAVSYSAASATDTGDDSVAITYSAASDSTFAIGTTEVTATATDDSGNDVTCTFDVTVVDTKDPTITCPSAPATTEATSSSGAAVSYDDASATDTGDDDVAITYSAASASTFAIGTTAVSYTHLTLPTKA